MTFIRPEMADDYQDERDRLRVALLDAADDLDKAANQFAGLLPDGEDQHIFAEKAARARKAAHRR